MKTINIIGKKYVDNTTNVQPNSVLTINNVNVFNPSAINIAKNGSVKIPLEDVIYKKDENGNIKKQFGPLTEKFNELENQIIANNEKEVQLITGMKILQGTNVTVNNITKFPYDSLSLENHVTIQFREKGAIYTKNENGLVIKVQGNETSTISDLKKHNEKITIIENLIFKNIEISEVIDTANEIEISGQIALEIN